LGVNLRELGIREVNEKAARDGAGHFRHKLWQAGVSAGVVQHAWLFGHNVARVSRHSKPQTCQVNESLTCRSIADDYLFLF
jgi:hypothetical protein